GIPWVHMFFGEQTLIKGYKELVKPLPDKDMRINFRISTNEKGKEYFSYINKMTIKRFNRIKKSCPLNIIYYKEVPLRGFLSPLTKLPLFKEMFVKMVVTVFEK
ncbi:MAG: class I SAM-dependent methyltransferase, partial [Bacillota bacterium]|nr:class I SAM-dependent methyltransferase [Bacillota bacterium]